MSIPGFPTNSNPGNPSAIYGRGDLQAAFNWLVNQPEHIRKQASDPDRLMTLYYRSTGRPDLARPDSARPEVSRPEPIVPESARMETEAPVSSQNFISDLRQINEAMRQFDRPGATGSSTASFPTPSMSASMASALSQSAAYAEVKAPPKTSTTSSVATTYSIATTSSVATAHSAATATIIAEVRDKLNLSSDAEAINALVAIGYRSLKPLLG